MGPRRFCSRLLYVLTQFSQREGKRKREGERDERDLREELIRERVGGTMRGGYETKSLTLRIQLQYSNDKPARSAIKEVEKR